VRRVNQERPVGYLDKGEWREGRIGDVTPGGEFVRRESQFRDFVTADGASGFQAEPGRYHLYVALSCPWAHRTVIFRMLKKLEGAISMSIVGTSMLDRGWAFTDEPGTVADTVNGFHHLYQVYAKAKPDYVGRVSVPVLWDKRRETIVNNESSEIIRMLNGAFDAFTDDRTDYYPAALRAEIDAVNAVVYENVNNGVYRAGFASTQAAYEAAFDRLFATLDELDARLARSRYLAGDRITEADWRLFTTLVRFDAVYHYHFKCNLRKIADYPHLSGYLRELYQWPGVAATVNFDHIKRHYYSSQRDVNPTGIVAKGPPIDLSAPHGRG
jgi:putative glutathione S-transferase